MENGAQAKRRYHDKNRNIYNISNEENIIHESNRIEMDEVFEIEKNETKNKNKINNGNKEKVRNIGKNLNLKFKNNINNIREIHTSYYTGSKLNEYNNDSKNEIFKEIRRCKPNVHFTTAYLNNKNNLVIKIDNVKDHNIFQEQWNDNAFKAGISSTKDIYRLFASIKGVHKSILIEDYINEIKEEYGIINIVVETFKLLGVTIDCYLRFNDHVKHIKSAVNRKLFALKKLSFLSTSVKVKFFKSFILPHFDYCSALIVFLNKKQINSIEKIFNLCTVVGLDHETR